MQIASSDLINLPVYTQSGQGLGRVVSFDLNIDSQTIDYYHVKTGLIKGWWHQELIIHRRQVVTITLEKMVVEDNVSTEAKTKTEPVELATPVARAG